MTIIRKWNSISLIIRILCGLAVGVILGLLIPNATGISVLGQLFVGALKAVAPVLVLVLVASSLANAKGGHAKKFRTVIILYLFSTMLAAVIAVIANFMFPTFIPLEGVTASEEYVAPSGMSEVIVNLLTNVVANPIDALLNANYIGILFWAVILGLALKRSSDSTKRFHSWMTWLMLFQKLYAALSAALHSVSSALCSILFQQAALISSRPMAILLLFSCAPCCLLLLL